MKLFELKSTVGWKWLESMPGEDVAGFFLDEDMEDQVLVSFGKMSSGAVDIEFTRNGEYNMTGERKEMLVMATVMDIVDDYIYMNQPKTITFGSDSTESGRVKLYTRLLNFFTKKGWKTDKVLKGNKIIFKATRQN